MKDVDEEGAVNTGSNLFVTGIAPRLTEGDVSRLFDKYGEVESCSIMLDPHTKESRGFGFVKMVTAEQADAAKEGLQGEVIEGRTLSIEKARRARPRTPTPGKYFGPPKRGEITVPLLMAKLTEKKEILAVLLAVAEVAIVIAMTIDLVVATAAAGDETTTADALAMTTMAIDGAAAAEVDIDASAMTTAHATSTATRAADAMTAMVAAVRSAVVEAAIVVAEAMTVAMMAIVPTMHPLHALMHLLVRPIPEAVAAAEITAVAKTAMLGGKRRLRSGSLTGIGWHPAACRHFTSASPVCSRQRRGVLNSVMVLR